MKKNIKILIYTVLVLKSSLFLFLRISILTTIITVSINSIYCSVQAADNLVVPPEQDWSSTGYFGMFDTASLQRGLKVYTEVCANCHSMKLLSYRDLEYLNYSPEQIKAYAAQFEVLSEPDNNGKQHMIPAKPSDKFVSPYANEQEARALNNGALPPDFSLIVKSRNLGKGSIIANFYDMLRGRGYASGADYVYALLTGYEDKPPKEFDLPDGKYYNTYYPGHAIAMAPPLYANDSFADGKPGTIKQQAKDVSAFLMWASEPKLAERRLMGIKVLLFLTVFFVILLMLKRKVWKEVH